MASDAGTTCLVTAAGGFIGAELVRVLVALGHRVTALVESAEAAERVRGVGAVAVDGRLLEAYAWRDAAAATWVFLLPSDHARTLRFGPRRAASVARARMVADTRALDALASGETRRIVYVVDASCYGATGPRPVIEEEPPVPSAWGRSLAASLDRLDGYVIAGLPIVTAFPGLVYGTGSWFRERVIEPVTSGRRMWQLANTTTWVSPIHLHDCARALVHLARCGEVGGRYFLVNRDPIRMDEFARVFARLANRPLRVWRLPAAAARLVAGRSLAADVHGNAVFSNSRLRETGFRFRYPTLEQGIGQILAALRE